ncbi:MAG: M64 family metallopeptidase [Magnetococcus sp. YQC-5]
MHIFKLFIVFVCGLMVWLGSWRVDAANVTTTIINNGDSVNRVDIVILGDGYTERELPIFATQASNLAKKFFTVTPFKEYSNFFNVHRIDVISPVSGASHPSKGVYLNTPLGASYDCSNMTRLICIQSSSVQKVLDDSIDAAARDIVVVLVNDPDYGGSGGKFLVTSMHQDSWEVAMHEIGHSFGLLADEYEGDCNHYSGSIRDYPWHVNITTNSDRANIKWNRGGGPPQGWIEPTTPLPTTSTQNNLVGVYEGAEYCKYGVYRPTNNSMMRTLGKSFDSVNTEQLVRRIYNFVDPIERVLPESKNLIISKNDITMFQVNTMPSKYSPLAITWKVDGKDQGSGTSFMLNPYILTVGSHTVTVDVYDTTKLVRNDPEFLLKATQVWNVTKTNANVTDPSKTGVDSNALPTGSVTITGTPTQGQILTAANTLADADGIGNVSYQWKAGGADILGAITSVLFLDEAQVGKVITVTANYTDGHGTKESVSSSATSAVVALLPTGIKPEISFIANQTVKSNESSIEVPFTVMNQESATGPLTFSVNSLNKNLIPDANIQIVADDTQSKLIITLVASKTGSSVITLTMKDGTKSSTSDFTLTVESANAVLDVDHSASVDATDGVLILRKLTGASTIDTGVVLPSGQTNSTVVNSINAIASKLDVDQSGTLDATDGVLILRKLTGASTIDTGVVLPSGQSNSSVLTAIDAISK